MCIYRTFACNFATLLGVMAGGADSHREAFIESLSLPVPVYLKTVIALREYVAYAASRGSSEGVCSADCSCIILVFCPYCPEVLSSVRAAGDLNVTKKIEKPSIPISLKLGLPKGGIRVQPSRQDELLPMGKLSVKVLKQQRTGMYRTRRLKGDCPEKKQCCVLITSW